MTLGFTIAAILSILFGGGAAISLRSAYRAFNGNDPYSDSFEGVMCAALALMLIACLLGTIAGYRYLSGPTFELMKSEWACTRSHTVQDDDGDYSVCDQYSRR